MCSDILQLVRKQPLHDTEVFHLQTALESANIIPRGQSFYVAFLGEQGIGKSSLVNGTLGRDLVNVSSGSSACTAVATAIIHKRGADDNTNESDFFAEYFNDDEIVESCREQRRRYCHVFPGKTSAEQINDDGDDISVEGSEEGDEDAANGDGTEEDEVNDARKDKAKGEDEDENQGEENEELIPVHNSPVRHVHQKKTSTASIRAAKTARTFFDIIFATEENEEQNEYLNSLLDDADLDDEQLSTLCVQQAKQRLVEVGACNGLLQHLAVHDEDLARTRSKVERLWPLVKSVRIETGHIHLRNNVCILDLPGKAQNRVSKTFD